MPNDQENTEPTALNDEDLLSASAPAGSGDPADEIPVPIAMSPAEIDERAQAVEAVRGTASTPLKSDAANTDARLSS